MNNINYLEQTAPITYNVNADGKPVKTREHNELFTIGYDLGVLGHEDRSTIYDEVVSRGLGTTYLDAFRQDVQLRSTRKKLLQIKEYVKLNVTDLVNYKMIEFMQDAFEVPTGLTAHEITYLHSAIDKSFADLGRSYTGFTVDINADPNKPEVLPEIVRFDMSLERLIDAEITDIFENRILIYVNYPNRPDTYTQIFGDSDFNTEVHHLMLSYPLEENMINTVLENPLNRYTYMTGVLRDMASSCIVDLSYAFKQVAATAAKMLDLNNVSYVNNTIKYQLSAGKDAELLKQIKADYFTEDDSKGSEVV
jgi:hypothetical protein